MQHNIISPQIIFHMHLYACALLRKNYFDYKSEHCDMYSVHGIKPRLNISIINSLYIHVLLKSQCM